MNILEKELILLVNHKEAKLYHFLMNISKRVFRQTHTRLEKVELYRGQPPILFALWEKDGRNKRELCELLNRQPATITKTTKRLENTDFVYSKKDDEDSRVTRVYLTEKGKAVQSEVEEIFRDLDEKTFKGFTDEEKQILETLLKKIDKNLSNG